MKLYKIYSRAHRLGYSQGYSAGFMRAIKLCIKVINPFSTKYGITIMHTKDRACWKHLQFENGNKVCEIWECTMCRHRTLPGDNRNYCPNCGAEMQKRPAPFI